MIVYDAAGVKTAISPDGSGSVYDANGRRVSSNSVSSSLYSFDNPPAAPSSYDDEFDTASLNAAWTVTSTGTTNPAVAGTVNPTSSLTTPVYDLATWPSWLLFQSDNSSTQTVDFTKTVSLGTNATFFCKLAIPNITTSAANEGNLFFSLWNSGDSNESLDIGLSNASGGGYLCRMVVQNNGVNTNVDGNQVSEGIPAPGIYVALWKASDVYYGGFSVGGVFYSTTALTKTGVTTFDRVRIRFRTANETPSFIAGVDFFRYYSTVTYSLRNPAV